MGNISLIDNIFYFDLVNDFCKYLFLIVYWYMWVQLPMEARRGCEVLCCWSKTETLLVGGKGTEHGSPASAACDVNFDFSAIPQCLVNYF